MDERSIDRRTASGSYFSLFLSVTVTILVALSGSSFAAPLSHVIVGAKDRYDKTLRQAGIEPHSRNPTESKPYAVCPAPDKGRVTCLSAVVPEGLASDERASEAGPRLEGSGEWGGFSPVDLRSAYNLPSTGGDGLTIAITIAFDYPTAEADLAVYRETYGLPPCTSANGCFKKVNQEGKAGEYPSPNAGWAAEAALDLDMASAICPECDLLLVEADDNSYENMPIAVQTAAELGANVISNSWGSSEFPGQTSFDAYLNHSGVPVLFASGDFGYEVSYPAASPYVIAVGGTSLRKDESARGWRETVWVGAGSGCSEYEPKPVWQIDAGCAKRTLADVAAVADPETPVSVYDTYGGYEGWLLFGGTSASAPILAGVEALSTSAERAAGAQFFWEQGPEGMLFDTTEGRNGACDLPIEYLCAARHGYDGPTGWGTPGGSRPGPPIVATEDVSDINPSDAVLRGSVNPNGSETDFHFEYGLTTEYGTSIPIPEEIVGSGIEPVEVDQFLTGLVRNETYHYRIVATNDLGTSYGGDHSFVTSLWSPEDMPAGGTREEMFGVSCTSVTSCISVGSHAFYFEGLFYNDAPVAQRWDGSRWIRELPPVLHVPAEGYSSLLDDVSCASPDACVAIGTNYEIDVGYLPLAEQWDGSQWSILPISIPPQAEPNGVGQYEIRMHAVTCATNNFCVAVGEVVTSSENEVDGLIEIWDGDSWTSHVLPGPKGSQRNRLWGVSCGSPGFCLAVGESRGGGVKRPYIERWDGDAWSLEVSAATSGGLQGVSCVSPSACMVVGGSDGEFGGAGIAEVWDGDSWASVPPDVPMRGVSCLAADSCLGVGGERTDEGESASGYAAQWDGSEWIAENPVLPLDASDDAMELHDVECVAGECVAVGWYWSWGFKPLAEHLSLEPSSTQPGAFTKIASVGAREATLRGTIYPKGLSTSFQFEYGPSTAYGTKVPLPAEDVGSGVDGVSVSEAIDELTPSSTYHFRIVATNESGATYSKDRPFTTLPLAPTVITKPGATDIGSEVATISGTVNPNAGQVIDCHIDYGLTASYGQSKPCIPSSPGSGNVPVNVIASLSGLTPGTTYHFRVVATNAGGTSYGDDEEFPTLAKPSQPPAVVTNPTATGITQTTAIVAGTVNPNSLLVTSCRVDYGPTAGYGESRPCTPASPGSGNSPVDVSTTLSGLSPGAIYHFRVVATNAVGTSYGDRQVFATLPGACGSPSLCPPPQGEEWRMSLLWFYRICVNDAREDFRQARRAAMHKRGKARKATLRLAGRRKHHALERCVARVNTLL